MADALATALEAACRGGVTARARLAGHTTLKVGGPARVLVEVESDADLAAIGRLAAEHDVRCLIVGGGSNLLVADSGWDGIAIVLGRAYRGYTVEGTTVRALGAEPLPRLASRLAGEKLTGFEFAVAVPGSIGGAVRMNAGAHGREMADVLTEVEVVGLPTGARETWPVAALGLRYRHSDLPDGSVVVAATLELEHADATTVEREIAAIRQWRRDHQPVNEPSCGSVFANPPGDSAGRLIDAAGAKGMRVGGAEVSDRHANFVVTRPGATAADVHALIVAVQARVAATSGIELAPEVVLAGDF